MYYFYKFKVFQNKKFGWKGTHRKYLFLENFAPPKRVKGPKTYLIFIVNISQIQHVTKNSSSKKSSDTHIAHILREQVLQGLANSITLCHNSLTTVITSAGWVSHQGSPTNDAFQALLQGRPKALLTEAQGIHDDLFLQRKHYWMSVLISVTSTIRVGANLCYLHYWRRWGKYWLQTSSFNTKILKLKSYIYTLWQMKGQPILVGPWWITSQMQHCK